MTDAAAAVRAPVEKIAPDTIRLERTLDAPAKLIAKGPASSPIDFSPSARLASMPRRVGSASARNVASSRFSTMWFNIAASQRIVNRPVE